jgi:hypothetical protein
MIHSEELRNLYRSSSGRIVKSWRWRWAGHVAWKTEGDGFITGQEEIGFEDD